MSLPLMKVKVRKSEKETNYKSELPATVSNLLDAKAEGDDSCQQQPFNIDEFLLQPSHDFR